MRGAEGFIVSGSALIGSTIGAVAAGLEDFGLLAHQTAQPYYLVAFTSMLVPMAVLVISISLPKRWQEKIAE